MSGPLRQASAIGLAALLGTLAAFLAPMMSSSAPTASALSDCDAPIEAAIFQATGQHTGQSTGAGLACNPYIYAPNGYTSQSDLQAKVNEVFGRCGDSTAGRYIVLALLETTGQPPQAGVAGFDNVCHQAVYENYYDSTNGGIGNVDFTKYASGTGNANNIHTYSAVNGVMQVCGQSLVSHAVVSVIDRHPKTQLSELPNHPTLHVPSSSEQRGQCNATLYGNGQWSSYADLKNRVIERATSNVACVNSEITVAYNRLSGWNPLQHECNAARYGNGTWGSLAELGNRAYHSLRCANEWLGQAYAFGATNRRIIGKGDAIGECNGLLYKNSVFVSYADTLDRVQATAGLLVEENVEIKSDGDLERSGIETDAAKVLVGSQSGAEKAATLNGRVFTDPSGGLVKLISDKGLGVISVGGGNVISVGGGNFVSTNNGNFINNNTGTLISEAVGSFKAFDR